MKKSQITMIMIVGLALFIMIGLLLYLSKSSLSGRAKQEVKKTIATPTEPQALKDYIQQCLDKSAKEGTYLLGQQGGVLYSSQGGGQVDYQDSDEGIMYANHKGNKVAYNINHLKRNVGNPEAHFHEAPMYPTQFFPYESQTLVNEKYSGVFGVSTMPAISKTEPSSMEVRLETYTENNVKSCANLENFREQGLRIMSENPKVQVTIGNTDISFSLSYPITSENAAGESVSFNEFSSVVNVRMRDLYLFSKELASKDTSDITFDISSPSNSRDGFSVTVFRGIVGYDDIIEITDQQSSINANPMQYVFARKNRMPVLHYVRSDIVLFEDGKMVTRSDVLSGQAVQHYDPDEDSLEWKIFKPNGVELVDSDPYEFLLPSGKFKVETTDGELTDYQEITAIRLEP
jgi:hypothetical protein